MHQTAAAARRLGLASWCTLAFVAVARVCNASAPTLDDVRAMRAVVEERGLVGFASARQATGWQAPVIPSAWYVSTVGQAVEKPYHEAARDFGSALLAAIDAWAPVMQTGDAGLTLANATALIDLAYWLGATEGYANLILAQRARDVALTGLARRVVDLTVPLGETVAQAERCRVPFDAAPVRARVLNVESGTRLFPVGAATTDADLATVWSRREISRSLRQLAEFPTPGPTPDEVSAGIQQLRALIAAVGGTPLPAQPSDVFFRDDEVPPPQTTRTTWSSNQHQHLLVSTTPENLYSLERLIEFRTVIGAFPTAPEVRQETASSPGEEAFADAWRPHIGTATLNLGRPAWSVYDRIQRGVFLDADSSRTRMVLARTVGVPETPTARATRLETVAETPTGAP